MTRNHRFLPTVRALSTWIILAVALALVGLFLVRRFVPVAVLRESNDAVGNYLQTLGTIYAVLLAFVTVVVWQQFNDARGEVENEANELVDLIRNVRGLPPATSGPFCQSARAYVETVLGEEWTAMATGDEASLHRGEQMLESMWDLLVAYEPCSECHKSLYEEALARFNDVSDRRVGRLSSSRLRIPAALRLLLYSGAAMTVGSMYLMAVERVVVHALMTVALAGAISHVLYIIDDLDNCFSGQWQVPRGPFVRVQRYLDQGISAGTSTNG